MPNGRGGNLTQPLKKVLINVPGPANLGTYLDTITGLRVLHFAQHGYTIPWTPGSTITVQRPQAAVMKVSTVQLSNVAPLDPLNYAYGVGLLKRVKTPGVDNSETLPHLKYYGGMLPSVTVPAIANAELNTMRDDIITQINNDIGYMRRPDYQHPGTVAIASAGIVINTWDAASAMTLDGNVVAAAANIAGFIANINALADYFAVEDPVTAGNIIIGSVNPATPMPIVFANTAGTIAQVATNGFIVLIQRYDDATFEVRVDPSVGVSRVIRPTTFSFLTNDDIFQVFSHIPNLGGLAQEKWPENMPLRGVPYVRVNIDVVQDHYALDGASHANEFITAVELYMPAAEWDVVAAGGVNNRWAALAANRIMDAGNGANVADVLLWWVS